MAEHRAGAHHRLAYGAGIVFIWSVIFPMLHVKMNTGRMDTILDKPFWYRFLVVTTAAVVEETFFRGYPIERVGEWLLLFLLGRRREFCDR